MNCRFLSMQLSIMKALQSCNPNSSHFSEVSVITEMASFYSLNTYLLSNECTLAKSTLKDKALENGILSVYKYLLPLSSAFPNLAKVLKIALTLAVSSAQCERSFSALKRIKMYLRTTMTEERLSDSHCYQLRKTPVIKYPLMMFWSDLRMEIKTGLSFYHSFTIAIVCNNFN